MKKKRIKLDNYEREILKSYDRGEWKQVKNVEHEKKRLQAAARSTLRKDKRISLRITSMDLEAIKMIAFREGIPYQTLIASVLHKYASGHIKTS